MVEEKNEVIDPRKADLNELILSMATILNNALHHYWFSESDEHQAIADCYQLAERILSESPEIAVKVHDGSIKVNEHKVPKSDERIGQFVDHLNSMDVNNLTIKQGISNDDFIKLIEIIDADPVDVKQLGGFISLLEQFGLENIESKKIQFTEITEEEVVVSKDEAGGGGSGDGEGNAGSILAFLKGDISADDAEALEGVKEAASDPSKMAELILRSAEIKQSSAEIDGGETLVDFVVGCMRRAYDGMSQDKTYKSKIGKKKISRNILMLEEEVIDRMRSSGAQWDDEELAPIKEVADEITKEIKIDALADEYMIKHDAIQKTENQVLDYIREKGSDGTGNESLKEKLMSRGLSLQGWRELVFSSGDGAGPGVGGEKEGEGGEKGAGPGGPAAGGAGGIGGGSSDPLSIMQAITHLDTLLDRMEKTFTGTEPDEGEASELMGALENVHEQVRIMRQTTGQAIEAFVDNLKIGDEEFSQAADGEGGEKLRTEREIRAERKKLLERIAEIVSCMNVPVAIVSSSLKMVDSRTMGGVTDRQKNVLRVAADNTEIMKELIADLQKISDV